MDYYLPPQPLVFRRITRGVKLAMFVTFHARAYHELLEELINSPIQRASILLQMKAT